MVFFLVFLGAFAPRSYDQKLVDLPTERAKEVGSDPTAAGGGVKGGERVAAVGVQRSRTVGKAHTGYRDSS